MTHSKLFALITVLLLSLSPLHAEEPAGLVGFLPDGPQITLEDITEAQEMWGEAVVEIGRHAKDPVKAAEVAKNAARTAYAFDEGPIQFKPTLANKIPFRHDLEGALSYFVGGNERSYPEDNGFALRPWSNVRFENDLIKITGNVAIAMGHYYFKDANTHVEDKVEYTKGYVKLPDGRVLIFLQHSSKPYCKCQENKECKED